MCQFKPISYLIFVTCSALLQTMLTLYCRISQYMSYFPLYPIYSHLIFFNYHNRHNISPRSTPSDATHNRARSALQISIRLSFFGQHMLSYLCCPCVLKKIAKTHQSQNWTSEEISILALTAQYRASLYTCSCSMNSSQTSL